MTINLSAKQDLPIAALEQEIIKLIENNQVVILSGETGSGKSTQLPKICAKIFEQNNKNNFNNQQIAHTQPRRVAAVSLAQRISDECNTKLGEYIGYQVRFDQKFSDNTKIKLMTDGMLLTEIQADRLLKKYHTIIIDEAHERSLNIDFLLGYIKYLLPKRPDLKIIITSATIEVDLFSRHFNNAPVIKVPGRTYPVDIIYQDIYENSSNISSGASASVNSETSSGSSFGLSSVISSVINSIDFLLNDTRSSLSGDILVFFATEKEIHETALLLERKNLSGVQVLKLFARLSPKEQKEIFNPGGKRRVILSTNVAETSVTVPRVHYVIDTGFARVSRYSYRSKMQHLPIERVSKASCNQRSGRCGRIAPGICIRLYSEEDFLSRDEQMSPEICRTNLSSVILLMLAHKLGDISKFPFLEPPDPKYIKDGYQVLFELGAIKNKDFWELTDIGKQMSRFPVDPRISRMILAGKKYHNLDYILIIASFLSAQDPRSRPVDKAQRADQLHAEYKDNKSDFIEILNLWNFINIKKDELSNSQFKSMCQKRFLSSLKIRQWQAIYQQLVWVVKNLKIDFKNNILNKNLDNNNYKLIIEGADYENLHKALMTGLVTHVSRLSDKDNKNNKDNKKNIGLYLSTRSRQGYIFPGSGLFKKKPKWLLSCYLRETQKVYFDCNAQIEPQWIEQVASHLVKKHYDEPVWSKKREQASVKEKVTLYGLEIASDKWVFYGNIDKKYAREMLIRYGLIDGEINLKADFFTKNNELLEDIEGYEDKIRTKGVLIDPEMLFDHYDRVLPDHIVSGASLKKWLKGLSKDDAQKLNYVKQDLENYAISKDTRVVDLNNNNLYPSRIQLGDNKFLLSYKFELGSDSDGVSVEIPLSLLKSVNNNSAINSAQWLIPALLIEKITAFIKALPKVKRKLCAPAPEYAKALYERAESDVRVPNDIGLIEFMAESLSSMSGSDFTIWDWMGVKSKSDGGSVEDYLFLRFVILNNNKILATGRDLNKIISDLDDTNIIKQSEDNKLTQDEIKWESSWVWDVLPDEREKEISGVMVKQYPALFIKYNKDNKNKLVGIGWENDKKNQQESLYQGLIVLCKNFYKPCLKKLISRSDVKAKISNLNIYWSRLDLGNLWDELSDFCVQEALGLFNKKNNLDVKTKSDFKKLLVPESDIIKILNLWIDKLLDIFKLENECRVLIKKATRQLGDAQIRDIKSQLDCLFNMNFLSSKNREYLNRYNVYLKGIKIRCEGAINNPLKIRQAFDKLADYWERFIDLENSHYINNITDTLFSYRWLVEEYRISLFAQSLGCSQKVSPKILDKYWNK